MAQVKCDFKLTNESIGLDLCSKKRMLGMIRDVVKREEYNGWGKIR